MILRLQGELTAVRAASGDAVENGDELFAIEVAHQLQQRRVNLELSIIVVHVCVTVTSTASISMFFVIVQRVIARARSSPRRSGGAG